MKKKMKKSDWKKSAPKKVVQTSAKTKSRAPLKPAQKVASRTTAAFTKENAVKLLSTVQHRVETAVEQIGALITSPKDIVAAIKDDHDGLRHFIKTLKDESVDMTERRRAYEGFSALLKSHSAAEEKAVYDVAQEMLTGRELHVKVAEGYIEHALAEDLMEKIEATNDPIEWTAHVNVLAEIIEHHANEEERQILPALRKAAKPAENMDMLASFLSLRGKMQRRITKKNAGVLESLSH